MKFKYVCPNCQATDKVVEKCRNCFKYSCADCTINQLCIDCFVKLTEVKEKKIYQEEKIKCLIKTY